MKKLMIKKIWRIIWTMIVFFVTSYALVLIFFPEDDCMSQLGLAILWTISSTILTVYFNRRAKNKGEQ